MKLCTFPNCQIPRFARRLCRMHYERVRRGVPMDPPRYASRLTQRQLDEIKVSKDSVRVIAVVYGISKSYAHMLRKGLRSPVGR